MGDTGRILVVDDDDAQISLFMTILEADGWEVVPATSGEAALAILDQGEELDVILTDLVMPGMDGRELLAAVQERRPEVPVVVMTAHASVDSAVDLLHAGAFHYLEKPTRMAELRITVRRARDATITRRELARLRRRLALPDGVVAISRQMREVLENALKVAPGMTPVLVSGEPGTGKEVVARAIHAASGRAGFVALNCAAIPATGFESELFGAAGQLGAVGAARNGTLFLDELASVPESLHPRLLAWLEDKKDAARARVIAATARNPDEEIAAGRLPGELLYKLGMVHLHLPPLRERPVDIPALAHHLLGRLGELFRLEPAELSPDALAALTAYQWPGNTREMENVLGRALALRSGRVLGVRDLPPHVARSGGAGKAAATSGGAMLTLDEVERRHILQVLERCGGNKLKAAEVLGIDRSTLHRKLRRIHGTEALQL